MSGADELHAALCDRAAREGLRFRACGQAEPLIAECSSQQVPDVTCTRDGPLAAPMACTLLLLTSVFNVQKFVWCYTRTDFVDDDDLRHVILHGLHLPPRTAAPSVQRALSNLVIQP